LKRPISSGRCDGVKIYVETEDEELKLLLEEALREVE